MSRYARSALESSKRQNSSGNRYPDSAVGFMTSDGSISSLPAISIQGVGEGAESSYKPYANHPVTPNTHGFDPQPPILSPSGFEALEWKEQSTFAAHPSRPADISTDFLTSENHLIASNSTTQPLNIPLRKSCRNFKPTIASSYPPTAGFYPWDPSGLRGKEDGKYLSVSRAIIPRPMSKVTQRQRAGSSTSHKRPSLFFVHENGQGATPPVAPRKGCRVGSLTIQQANQAAKNRKEKSVCIRCRLWKQSVSITILSVELCLYFFSVRAKRHV